MEGERRYPTTNGGRFHHHCQTVPRPDAAILVSAKDSQQQQLWFGGISAGLLVLTSLLVALLTAVSWLTFYMDPTDLSSRSGARKPRKHFLSHVCSEPVLAKYRFLKSKLELVALKLET